MGNLCPKFYIFGQKIDHWPKKSKYWSFIQNSKDYSVVFYILCNNSLSNIKSFYYENSMCNRIENSLKLTVWSVQKKKLVILFFHKASFCKFRNEQISECENSMNYVLNLPVILVETCSYFKQESIKRSAGVPTNI